MIGIILVFHDVFHNWKCIVKQERQRERIIIKTSITSIIEKKSESNYKGCRYNLKYNPYRMISNVSYSYLCPWSVETPTASCLYPAVVDSVAFVAVVATVAAVAAGYSRPPARYPGSPRFPPFFFPLSLSLSNFTVPCVSFFSFSFFLLFSNRHEPRHFLSPLGETKNAIRSSHGFRDEASRDIGSDTFFGYRSAEKKKNLLSLRTLSTNYFSRRSITELFSLLSFFFSSSSFFFYFSYIWRCNISRFTREMSFIIVILFVDRTLDLGSLLIPSFAFDSFLRYFIADDFPSLSLSLLSRHPTRFTIRLLSTAWTSTSRSYKEKIPRRLPRNSVSRRWTLARLRIAIRMPSLPRTRLKMHCQGPPTPCVHPIDRDVDPVKVGRLGWLRSDQWRIRCRCIGDARRGETIVDRFFVSLRVVGRDTIIFG